MPERPLDPRAVFLNFPFDRSYEQVFLGIISALISLKLTPRCVVEIPDHGEGRMDRLYNLIKSCRSSIHELSRVRPVRFNIPFELGIAYSPKQGDSSYQFVIFERISHRFERSLTDLKMIDPRFMEAAESVRCSASTNVSFRKAKPSLRNWAERFTNN